jgi:pimeloyl-ACP methyl ester carboxylesterase
MFLVSKQTLLQLTLQSATSRDSGPPLVLLHGVLRGWRDFASLWPALVPRWQIHALDLRGHGGSDRSSAPYIVREYANDVREYVQMHLHGEVVLFGHSLGALVAAAVAAWCPDRVRAIILEDPPAPSFLHHVADTPWHTVWTGMRELASSTAPTSIVTRRLAEVRQPTPTGAVRLGEIRDPASLRFSARCLKDVDPQVFPPLLDSRWLDGFDVETIFAQVQCPALLLRGDTTLGGMLGRQEAEELTARMADGLLVDVPGVGHLIHAQATEMTLRLLLNFLESL